MRKLAKVGTMIAIAVVMQIGACKLAYNERGYQAFGGERLILPAVLVLEYKALCEPEETLDDEE